MSLRLRLLLAFAYVLTLMLVALELPLALNVSRRIDAEVKAQAAGTAHIVAASAAGSFTNPQALERVVLGAGRDLRGRVIVVDDRGRLLADSAGTGLRGTSYSARPEIASALRGTSAQGVRHSSTLGVDLLFTAVPLAVDGSNVGAVRVTQSVQAVTDRKRRDIFGLLAVGGLALALGLGVAWILAGSLSRPLRSLAVTARRLGAGDLEARAPLTGASDQQAVASAFNDMAHRLSLVLDAQREFVANASHQLRTPLTGLRLRLEAARAAEPGPKADKQLAAAELETERLAGLLSELLTLARAGEDVPADAAASLAEALEAARERWAGSAEREGRELLVRSNGDAAAVRVTQEDLATMLDNLIENALRYSPGGSQVELACGREAGVAWVRVLDRGPGVSSGEAGRVFERFVRGEASRDVPGTGLGLAIVRTLAERWDGSVSLTNRTGGGAQAEIRLPERPTG